MADTDEMGDIASDMEDGDGEVPLHLSISASPSSPQPLAGPHGKKAAAVAPQILQQLGVHPVVPP